MPLTRAARPLSASLQLRTSRSVRESAWPQQPVSFLPSVVYFRQFWNGPWRLNCKRKPTLTGMPTAAGCSLLALLTCHLLCISLKT